jgi:glycosyltransferase involved in cell wall biosynthesis
MQKKVLIVTYYWPPSGGSGVQRWLKTSRYLGKFGWMPFVYTPENPEFGVKDESLCEDISADIKVIKKKIFEPIRIFNSLFQLTGKKVPEQKDLLAQRNHSTFRKITTWMRGNLFLPDPRILWVRPSVKTLKKIISEEGIQVIITTGPPHSMHLIGKKLKELLPQLIWYADFRDPWSEWDLWPLLMTSENSMRRIRSMEAEVLKKADLVISISKYHVERLRLLGAKKTALIPNGFDEDDFLNKQRILPTSFIIRHLGTVDELRDPRPFLLAVERLISKEPSLRHDLKIEFYGGVNAVVKKDILRNPVTGTMISFKSAVPHNEVIDLYLSSSVLLLVLAHTSIAEGNTPGKMYEYMASGTPIVGIGPSTGDAADILKKTKTGVMIERNDIAGIEQHLLSLYETWKSGILITKGECNHYSRKSITKQLCAFMDESLQMNHYQ